MSSAEEGHSGGPSNHAAEVEKDSVPVKAEEPNSSVVHVEESSSPASSSSSSSPSLASEKEEKHKKEEAEAAALAAALVKAGEEEEKRHREQEEALHRDMMQQQLKKRADIIESQISKRREAGRQLATWEHERKKHDTEERQKLQFWLNTLSQKLAAGKSGLSELQKAMKERLEAEADYAKAMQAQTKLLIGTHEIGSLKDGVLSLSQLSSSTSTLLNEWRKSLEEEVIEQFSELTKRYGNKGEEVMDEAKKLLKELDEHRDKTSKHFKELEDVSEEAIQADKNGTTVTRDPWLSELFYRRSLRSLEASSRMFRENMAKTFSTFTKLEEWRTESIKTLVNSYLSKQKLLHSRIMEMLDATQRSIQKIDGVADRQQVVRQSFTANPQQSSSASPAAASAASLAVDEPAFASRSRSNSMNGSASSSSAPAAAAPSSPPSQSWPMLTDYLSAFTSSLGPSAGQPAQQPQPAQPQPSVPQPPPSVGVVKKGFLLRQSTVLKVFKQNFVVLTWDGVLHRFSSPEDESPEESILLSNCTLVAKPEEGNVFELVEGFKGFKSVFKKQNRLLFKTDTQELLIDWNVAIKDRIENASRARIVAGHS